MVLSFCYLIQTGPRTHSASSPMGTAVPSPGIKRPGREADHSAVLMFSADVRNA